MTKHNVLHYNGAGLCLLSRLVEDMTSDLVITKQLCCMCAWRKINTSKNKVTDIRKNV